MTFLLPILVAVALNFMGSIDLSSLGELHFSILENDLPPQTITWLERYGPVTAYGKQEELTAAINEPSTLPSLADVAVYAAHPAHVAAASIIAGCKAARACVDYTVG